MAHHHHDGGSIHLLSQIILNHLIHKINHYISHFTDTLNTPNAESCIPLGDETWVDAESGLVLELTTHDLKAFDKTQRVKKHQKYAYEFSPIF